MSDLEELAKKVNRRLQQEELLYDLCGNDFEKLIQLENQLQNHHLFACPGDKEEVERVLSL